MAVVKPEMKSYVWLQTVDGLIQQVEEEVAMLCPVIRREILHKSMGSSKTNPIILPERVNPQTLGLILDYCRFYQVPGYSNKERKAFDEKFVKLDTKRLCDLTSAADSLQLKPLVDLTSRTLARIIEGKTPEEIRDIFNLPDDLTEEEKLEPLKNMTDDKHIKLLNRLYARKRKELKERQKLKNVEAEEEPVDERSVDDLVLFINGGNKDSKGSKVCKNKKKNRRRKDNANASSSDDVNGNYEAANGMAGPVLNTSSADLCSLELQYSTGGAYSPKQDFDDEDDELDPEMREELDREVEDFARRLNSDWPERMQEILSSGQARRIPPISLGVNCSSQRYTGTSRR